MDDRYMTVASMAFLECLKPEASIEVVITGECSGDLTGKLVGAPQTASEIGVPAAPRSDYAESIAVIRRYIDQVKGTHMRTDLPSGQVLAILTNEQIVALEQLTINRILPVEWISILRPATKKN